MFRRVYCSNCGQEGHNKRGCPEIKKVIEHLKKHDDDHETARKYSWWQVAQAKNKIRREKTVRYNQDMYGRRAGKRRCSYCGEEGHNKRTCQAYSQDRADYREIQKDFRRQYVAYLAKHGLIPGASMTIGSCFIQIVDVNQAPFEADNGIADIHDINVDNFLALIPFKAVILADSNRNSNSSPGDVFNLMTSCGLDQDLEMVNVNLRMFSRKLIRYEDVEMADKESVPYEDVASIPTFAKWLKAENSDFCFTRKQRGRHNRPWDKEEFQRQLLQFAVSGLIVVSPTLRRRVDFDDIAPYFHPADKENIRSFNVACTSHIELCNIAGFGDDDGIIGNVRGGNSD